MRARTTSATRVKVRAGIKGNEVVDRLAAEGALKDDAPESIDLNKYPGKAGASKPKINPRPLKKPSENTPQGNAVGKVKVAAEELFGATPTERSNLEEYARRRCATSSATRTCARVRSLWC